MTLHIPLTVTLHFLLYPLHFTFSQIIRTVSIPDGRTPEQYTRSVPCRRIEDALVLAVHFLECCRSEILS